MLSCKRSPATAEDEKEEEYEDEDTQAKNEFEVFKRWLDGTTPSSSAAPLKCKICGLEVCR